MQLAPLTGRATTATRGRFVAPLSGPDGGMSDVRMPGGEPITRAMCVFTGVALIPDAGGEIRFEVEPRPPVTDGTRLP